MPLFITGSSGVGKSELVPLMRTSLPAHVRVHDFDELLTEDVAFDSGRLDEWRKKTVRRWFDIATGEEADGFIAVVLGLMHPSEIYDAAQGKAFRLMLLDCSQSEIERRLHGKRFATEERVNNLKRGTGLTPDKFITQNTHTMDCLRTEAREAGAFIIDTTEDTPAETAAKIVQWVME